MSQEEPTMQELKTMPELPLEVMMHQRELQETIRLLLAEPVMMQQLRPDNRTATAISKMMQQRS